jgi:hypothetical protein
MIKTTYRWVWKHEGSDRIVEVSTFQSKEVAINIALSYFPDDAAGQEFIKNNEPEIMSTEDV